MRALVLEGIGRFGVQNRPDPHPNPGEVVVAVAAAGICGSDLHGFSGENGRRHPGQVMGHEAAGVVAAVGAGVEGLPLGAAVTVNPLVSCGRCERCRAGEGQRCPGRQVIGVEPSRDAAFADSVLVPAANVHLLPDGLPVEFGALIEPLAVGVHALRRSGARPGDRLLVVGGGPIGQSVVVAARSAGLDTIVVSEPDPSRRALCESLGALALDPGAERLADAVASHLGDLATVAIDAVGIAASIRSALEATVIGAPVVLLGMGSPQVLLAAFDVSVAERSVIGSYAYSDADFAAAVATAAQFGERLRHLVSGIVPASGAQVTFERLIDAPPAGKVLLAFPL